MGSQNIGLYDTTTQRRRKSGNASFQADLGSGFTLTSDYFYARQDAGRSQCRHPVQFHQLARRDLRAAAIARYRQPRRRLLRHARDPAWENMQLYTTQVYEKWPGDVESFSQIIQKNSVAKNFNLQLDLRQRRPVHRRAARHPRHGVTSQSSKPTQHFRFRRRAVAERAERRRAARRYHRLSVAAGRQPRVQRQRHSRRTRSRSIADFGGRNITVTLPTSLADNFAEPQRLDDEDAGILRRLRPQGRPQRAALRRALRLRERLQARIRRAQQHPQRRQHRLDAGHAGVRRHGRQRPERMPGALRRRRRGAWTAASCYRRQRQGYFRAGPLSAQQMLETPPPLAEQLEGIQQPARLGHQLLGDQSVSPWTIPRRTGIRFIPDHRGRRIREPPGACG